MGSTVKSETNRVEIPDMIDVPRKMGGKQSLLAFFGYSVGIKSTEEGRRGCLRDVVKAELVVTKGSICEPWIARYGNPDTGERKRMVLSRLEELLSGMYWVKNDPVKHANKMPEYKRRESDIKWFKDTYAGDLV